MQTAIDPAVISNITVDDLVATRIQDDLSWGEGAIVPQAAYTDTSDQKALITAVLQSIEPVSGDEAAYSSCTDGRIPVKLLSGEAIPVREQMVGADMVSAFFVAEVLGSNFYKDPKAPVAERVQEVAAFLRENDLLPSSHIGCGAAAGFVAIAGNILRFASNQQFVSRVKSLLPEGIFSEELLEELTADISARLEAGVYEGLTADAFLETVTDVSGDRAVAELQDDGRGIHGHVEEFIIRVRMPGHAINEAKVAQLTEGREVFGVNDTRLEKLARLFGRGNDIDFRKAYIALESFADAGHATLAKDLPTWIITRSN